MLEARYLTMLRQVVAMGTEIIETNKGKDEASKTALAVLAYVVKKN